MSDTKPEDRTMASDVLAGVRVIEWGDGIAVPFCGKLLADFGAEVVKVEPPGYGDSSRQHGPFPDDVPHPDRSPSVSTRVLSVISLEHHREWFQQLSAHPGGGCPVALHLRCCRCATAAFRGG